MPNPKKHFDTECLRCGSIITGYKKYCNNRCQQAYQRDLKIKAWLSGDLSGGGIHGCRDVVRNWLLDRAEHKCEKCGWKDVHPVTRKVPLQVNHINGDPLNHSPENLEVLCPNCHALTETFGNLNRGKGRKLNPKLSESEGRRVSPPPP